MNAKIDASMQYDVALRLLQGLPPEADESRIFGIVGGDGVLHRVRIRLSRSFIRVRYVDEGRVTQNLDYRTLGVMMTGWLEANSLRAPAIVFV